MLIKGTFEFDVNGIKRHFKFGMLASDYFCEEEKISLNEMQSRLSNPTPRTAINCAYAAAKSYCESKGIDAEFKRAEVADWLDEIGVDKFFSKIYESIEVYQDEKDKKELEKKA